MSICNCCSTYSASGYSAYDNFCDPYRYSINVDGKYIGWNKHSCLHCGRCNKKRKDKDKDKTKSKYISTWTGRYPDPYRGEWKLTKNGKDVSNLIPSWKKYKPMYTFGEYPVYYLSPGHMIESYVCDGLKAPEWIRHNLYWIMMIADDSDEFSDIYEAFHANDWRYAPIAPHFPEMSQNTVPGYFCGY